MLLTNKAKHSQLKVSYKENLLSYQLVSSGDSFNFFMQIWDKSLIGLQEQIYIIYLNNANRAISWRLLSTGNGSKVFFDIKLAMACGLNCMASKMIIAHNHPGGLLKPSAEDVAITKKFYAAADMMDIKLIDHLVIANGDYYSFIDHKIMAFCESRF